MYGCQGIELISQLAVVILALLDSLTPNPIWLWYSLVRETYIGCALLEKVQQRLPPLALTPNQVNRIEVIGIQPFVGDWVV